MQELRVRAAINYSFAIKGWWRRKRKIVYTARMVAVVVCGGWRRSTDVACEREQQFRFLRRRCMRATSHSFIHSRSQSSAASLIYGCAASRARVLSASGKLLCVREIGCVRRLIWKGNYRLLVQAGRAQTMKSRKCEIRHRALPHNFTIAHSCRE